MRTTTSATNRTPHWRRRAGLHVSATLSTEAKARTAVHKPPHRYAVALRRGVHLPQQDRRSCIMPPENDGHPWCGVKHTAERYAARHYETLNAEIPDGKPRFSPSPIYRTERDSAGELHRKRPTLNFNLGEASTIPRERQWSSPFSCQRIIHQSIQPQRRSCCSRWDCRPWRAATPAVGMTITGGKRDRS